MWIAKTGQLETKGPSALSAISKLMALAGSEHGINYIRFQDFIRDYKVLVFQAGKRMLDSPFYDVFFSWSDDIDWDECWEEEEHEEERE